MWRREPGAIPVSRKNPGLLSSQLERCNVLRAAAVDGWLYLQLRVLAYDDGAKRTKNGYRELLSLYWIKEDFAHFVRRVNKGLALTMIKDGDE